MLQIFIVRHLGTFQITRNSSIDRQRETLRYVSKLTKSDAEYWTLCNHVKRTLPNFRPRIVIRIDFAAIDELADQVRTPKNRCNQTSKPDDQPNLTRYPAARPNGCNSDHCDGGQGCTPR